MACRRAEEENLCPLRDPQQPGPALHAGEHCRSARWIEIVTVTVRHAALPAGTVQGTAGFVGRFIALV